MSGEYRRSESPGYDNSSRGFPILERPPVEGILKQFVLIARSYSLVVGGSGRASQCIYDGLAIDIQQLVGERGVSGRCSAIKWLLVGPILPREAVGGSARCLVRLSSDRQD